MRVASIHDGVRLLTKARVIAAADKIPVPAYDAYHCNENNYRTVAILTQGTSWAVAVTQASFVSLAFSKFRGDGLSQQDHTYIFTLANRCPQLLEL